MPPNRRSQKRQKNIFSKPTTEDASQEQSPLPEKLSFRSGYDKDSHGHAAEGLFDGKGG